MAFYDMNDSRALLFCSWRASWIRLAMDRRIESAIQQTLSLWKFNKLRPKQLLVINRFCTGSDVFVALPTGSGKSVCYWILPSLFKILCKKDRSTVVVISPLDVLMKDQERSVSQFGVKVIVASDASEEQLGKDCMNLYLLVLNVC